MEEFAMSEPLDAFQKTSTSIFEGQIKDVEFYQTARGDKYLLLTVRRGEKPLAIPEGMKLDPSPSRGYHISALNVTEGREFIFVGHRSIVTITPPDWEVWKKPSKVDQGRKEQAEALILEVLRKRSEVCSDDVYNEICTLFPERDPRIIGVVFLGLAKRGVIHKVGYRPSERKENHHRPLPVWHLVKSTAHFGGHAT